MERDNKRPQHDRKRIRLGTALRHPESIQALRQAPYHTAELRSPTAS